MSSVPSLELNAPGAITSECPECPTMCGLGNWRFRYRSARNGSNENPPGRCNLSLFLFLSPHASRNHELETSRGKEGRGRSKPQEVGRIPSNERKEAPQGVWYIPRYVSTSNINSSYLDDKAVAVSNNQVVTVTQNFVTSEPFKMIREQAKNWAANTEMLLRVLDKVAEVHPFIKGVSGLTSAVSVTIHSSRCSGSYCVQCGG